MPVMDGIEATRAIKDKNKSIVIIATTAYAMKEEVENIMREDFDDYISKPFNSKRLIECLSKYLKNVED